jgi:hypothetical protein
MDIHAMEAGSANFRQTLMSTLRVIVLGATNPKRFGSCKSDPKRRNVNAGLSPGERFEGELPEGIRSA